MDTVTAFFIGILMMLANGGVLGLMHGDLPRNLRPSAFSWRMATLLFAMGCVLFAIQRELPAGFVLPLANGMVMLGFTGYLRALRQFYGRRDTPWILLPFAVGTLGVFWFAVIQPNILARILIVSLSWIFLALACASTLVAARQGDRARSRKVLAAIFIMVAVFTLLRLAFYVITGMQNGATILDSGNWMNIATPIIVATVPVIGTTAFLLLCSERLRTNAEKIAASKTLFLANMSHELRTPLNAILGFSQILNRSEGLSEQQRSNLATVNRSGEHLLTLINRILDMSKLEEGKLELQPTAFELDSLLDDLRLMFSLAASAKGLLLTVERAPDLPQMLLGDELRLRQVLINLLNNAIKFTQQGQIRVAVLQVSPPDDKNQLRVRFEVHDSGIGIAKQELDELFQVFTQTESGRQSRSGTGLGLALSRRFVELMNGRIGVNSTAGQGSEFWFEVDLLASDSQIAVFDKNQQPLALCLAPGTAQLRLLVVDDHQENRDVMSQLLGSWGFEVASAADGAQGVAEWRRFAPDLIWMDLRMPVMDGITACKTIHEEARQTGKPPPKIIAITASHLDLQDNIIAEHGFLALVGKPFRESDIRDLLQTHLGVRFTSAAMPLPPASKPDADKPELVASLRRVDALLLANFSKAVLLADFDAAGEVISAISKTEAKLAKDLKRLLDDYRFDVLQTLIEQASGIDQNAAGGL